MLVHEDTLLSPEGFDCSKGIKDRHFIDIYYAPLSATPIGNSACIPAGKKQNVAIARF